MTDWKGISRRLVKLHEDHEAGIIRFSSDSFGEMVNLSNENSSMEVEGKKITAKKVRKFLWEQRNQRALKRKNAVVWSAYVEDEDKSYIGVVALTSPEVAARLRGE